MKRIFRRLFAALCVVAALHPQQLSAETMLFGKLTKLVKHSRVGLTQQQRGGLEWLSKDKQYFGAIAIVPDSGVFAAFRGFHSLVTVRRFALEGCRIIAKSDAADPAKCLLYASVLPRSMDAGTVEAAGLGRGAYIAYSGKYQREQRPGKFGAFAISGMSDFGYTFGFDTEADAIGSAVARCEAAAAHEIAGFDNETRARIAKEDLASCRVFHITRPGG